MLGLAMGCAQIHSREVSTDAPMSPTVDHQRIDNSTTYETTVSVRGEVIRLDVEQSERCTEITTPRAHRTTAVTRTTVQTTTNTTKNNTTTTNNKNKNNNTEPTATGY